MQTALHRYGIEFSNEKESTVPVGKEIECNFRLDQDKSVLEAEIEGKKLSFPLNIPFGTMQENDLFEIDSNAIEKAGAIYEQLRNAFS